jgi:hypothetical protein
MKLSTKKDHIVYKCAYCKGNPVQFILKELGPLDLTYLKKYFVFATPPKPLNDFVEIWYKKDYINCVDTCMHITGVALSN